MARSILGLIGLGATLVFALPAAMLGLEFILTGRTVVGAGLVVVAGLMIAVEEYVTTPGDLPSAVASRVLGRALGPEEDVEE